MLRSEVVLPDMTDKERIASEAAARAYKLKLLTGGSEASGQARKDDNG